MSQTRAQVAEVANPLSDCRTPVQWRDASPPRPSAAIVIAGHRRAGART